jgi:hypothetical protein
MWKVNIFMISDTTLNGRFTLRACNVNNRTQKEDFDYLINKIKIIGEKLTK